MGSYLTEEEEGLEIGAIEALAKRDPFSKYLPYHAYEEESGEYFLHDGPTDHVTSGYLWECQPLTFVSDKSLRALAQVMQQEHARETVIQFVLAPDEFLDDHLDDYVRLKIRKDEVVQEAAQRYAAHLNEGRRGLNAMGGIRVRNFRLFCSIKSPKGVSKELAATVQEGLKGAGLFPRRLEPARLLEWLRRLFNARVPRSVARTYDPSRYIRNQVCFSDEPVKVDDRAGVMRVGGRLVAGMSPKSLKGDFDSLVINKLIGGYLGREDDGNQLKHAFIWSTSIVFKIKKSDVALKVGIEGGQRAGGSVAKELGRRNKENDWVLDDMERMPYCNVVTSMMIFGRDEEDLNDGISRARANWEREEFVMQRETKILPAMFVASMPFGLYIGKDYSNLKVLERDFPVSIMAASLLCPIQADFIGGMRPLLPYIGRKGQLIGIDVFDKNTNNHNWLAAAESGAGKSFQTNFLAGQYYGAGAKIRITDIGYSYKKHAYSVGGRFIDVAGEKGLCMNPLMSTVSAGDDDDRAADESNSVKIVLTMVYSATGTGMVTETHYSLIKDAVRFAIREDGGLMGIDHIYRYLREYPKYAGGDEFVQFQPLAREMAFNIRDFTSSGRYGRLFNGKPTLNIAEDDFVVLELEELLNDPELFRVVTMQCINMITQDLYLSNRADKRFIIFDEAWKYLGAGDVSVNTALIAGVIEEGYRRARKYGGSTGIVTQSPLDLLKFGNAGGVIKANAAFKFFLQCSDYEEAVAKGVLPYQGLHLELAKSVKNNRPHYSEVLFDTPFGAGIGRLCMDKFLYWVYTSAADEVAAYEALTRTGLTPLQALKRLAGEKA